MIRQSPGQAPPSPCLNICVLDANDTCTGCLRTVDEIARWAQMSSAERWRVLADLERRRAGCSSV